MKISHNVEFKIGDSKLLLSFIAALILLLTVSCGGGGGGGAVGGSSSPVVAVSFDGLSRSAAGGRSAVWTVAASIDLKIYVNDAVVLETTVTQANSAVSVEDVEIGSKAKATAVVHRIGGTTSNAVSDEIITVAGTNTLTLYIEYQCVLNGVSPVQTITYTSQRGLELPQCGPNLSTGLPHAAWETADGTRYPIGPVDLSGGSPGDLVLTPVYESPAPIISFSATPLAPITEEITLSTGGSANNITVYTNIDSVDWDDLGGIVSVTNSGFSHTITAISAGTATITAVDSSDPTKKTTCTIKVIDGDWNISDVGAIGVDFNSVSGDVTIPEKLAGQTVTAIGVNAFNGCTSLESVIIPDGVTSIGGYAFYNCSSLTSVIIPDSVTIIRISAFDSCTVLESVDIPDSVTEIELRAFSDCRGLKRVTISDGVTTIRESVFEHCGLESVTIPVSVTAIEQYAFQGCTDLESVTIPNTVTTIGDWAFDACSALNMVTCYAPVTLSFGTEAFPISPKVETLQCPDTAAYNSEPWISYFVTISPIP